MTKLGIPIFFALLLSLSACRDDGPQQRDATLYNIVELADSTAAPSFFLYEPDGQKVATLQSNLAFTLPEGLKVGDCIYLGYIPESGQPFASGKITPVGYNVVNNSPLMKAPADKLQGWDHDAVYLMSLWRAGNNVVVRVKLGYDTNPRLFSLVVDEATANDPIPQAYLAHQRDNDTPTFDRQYYAAFNLSALWARPGVEALDIHIHNTNLPTMQVVRVQKP